MYDDLRDAIANQPNSPHVFDLSPTGDHVETNRENPVNNRVDNFITGVLATNPAQHFGDGDDDGIPDYVDNCRGIANPDQAPSVQDPRVWCGLCDQCLRRAKLFQPRSVAQAFYCMTMTCDLKDRY